MLYHPSTQNVIGVRPTLYDLINVVVITKFLVNDIQGHHVWMWLVCYPYLSVQISGKETNAPSSHCPSMRNTAEKNRKLVHPFKILSSLPHQLASLIMGSNKPLFQDPVSISKGETAGLSAIPIEYMPSPDLSIASQWLFHALATYN